MSSNPKDGMADDLCFDWRQGGHTRAGGENTTRIRAEGPLAHVCRRERLCVNAWCDGVFKSAIGIADPYHRQRRDTVCFGLAFQH
jgi:hypothetical protein